MLAHISYDEDDADSAAERTTMLEVGVSEPSPPQAPCLIVTSGDFALGLTFRLRGAMVIGRTVGCDIVLSEENVSRRHAKIMVDAAGKVEIVDLGSANGIVVDGRRVERAVLEEGARFGIGRATLLLLQMDDVDALMARNQGVRASERRSGLLSRRYFLDALGWELGQPDRADRNVVVACCAVDDLAARRDQRGNEAAEGLVRRLASTTVETLQDPELALGRTADDEVSLFYRADSPAAAVTCAEWICKRGVGAAAGCTVSVGVVVAPRAGSRPPPAVFAAAQRALLQARARGGGAVQVATIEP